MNIVKGLIIPLIASCIVFPFLTTSSAQDTLWTKEYGTSSNEGLYRIKMAADSGFIAVGNTNRSAWLVKTNIVGDTNWVRYYHFQYITNSLAIQPLEDSSYIVVGNVQPDLSNNAELLIFKVDKLGQEIWTKYYGGIGYDVAYDIKKKADGGFIIVGQFDRQNIWLLNTDSNGDTLWTRFLGEPAYNNQGYSVDIASDKGYLIGGLMVTGNFHPALIKTDSLGNIQWLRIFELAVDGCFNSVTQTSDINIIAAGYCSLSGRSHDLFVVKITPSGNTIWTKTYGGINDDYAQDIIETPGGGYLVAGISPFYSTTYSDAFLLRLSEDGDSLWSRIYGWSGGDEFCSVDRIEGNTYVLAGRSSRSGNEEGIIAKFIDRHVWYISISGSDWAGDGSETNPFRTIQRGINIARDRDTVLVYPGTFVENINLDSDNIVLGSLFLTTGDTSHIVGTIIDGDSAGSVITANGFQDSMSLICGFTIRNGLSQHGGGIFCDSLSDIKILNNHIINNISIFNGGGIYLNYSNSIVFNNLISSNLAYGNGGGIFKKYGSSIIDSNVITNNISSEDGAGLFIGNSYTIIRSNIISHNSAAAGIYGRGGGLMSDWSNLTLEKNILSYNTVLGCGGAIYNDFYSRIICDRNIINNNWSPHNGGAIIIDRNCKMIISNCTIVSNSASEYYGGISCLPDMVDSLVVYNSIIRNNIDPYQGSQIYAPAADLFINYTNIQGGWSGEGNIDCDPMFCDPDNGNYYLAENSCCATAGDSGQYIGALGIGCESPSCNFLPGDINSDGQRIGADVTYGVRYFKALGPQPPDSCYMDSTSAYLYVAGDVNGNCEFRGSDITRLVSFFKGNATLSYCHFFPTEP